VSAKPQILGLATPIRSAGWIVELMRCDHLDEAEGGQFVWFAVNLIAPQAGSTGNWTTESPLPDYSADMANRVLGKLLRPWRWSQPPNWQVWGRASGSTTWVSVRCRFDPGDGMAPTATEVDSLRDSFDAEFDARTYNCGSAFSRSDERWQGHRDPAAAPGTVSVIEQSHVHAIAPLTHCPVSLSNRVFGVAGFVRIAKADASPFETFVAFPEITYGGTGYVPRVPDGTASTYAPPLPANVTLRCSCDPAAISTVVPLQVGTRAVPPLLAGSRARDVVEPVFVAHALPLDVVAAVIRGMMKFVLEPGTPEPVTEPTLVADQVFLQLAWQNVLLRLLGSGWFRRRVTGKAQRPHILQFSGTRADVEALSAAFPGNTLETTFVPPILGVTVDWLARLRDELPKPPLQSTPEQSRLRDAIERLMKPVASLPAVPGPTDYVNRRHDLDNFFGAWAYIASEFLGDRRAAAFTLWLRMRVSLQGSSSAPAEIRKIRERLPRLVTAEVADRMLAGSLDETAANKVWGLLDALVKVNEDPAQEELIRDQIRDWCAEEIKVAFSNVVLPAPVDKPLELAAQRVLEDFRAQGHRTARRYHDEGLWLRFDSTNDASQRPDGFIRGYAVALRARLRRPVDASVYTDSDRAAWLTETAIRFYRTGAWPPISAILTRTDKSAALAQRAIGSSWQNGSRVVQIVYTGRPVAAALEKDGSGALAAGRADEDSRAFDYRWPAERPVPLLGYGLEYSGTGTLLDNAGGVVEPTLRQNDSVAETKLVSDSTFPWPTEFVSYRSCCPPGAPHLLSVTFNTREGGPTAIDPLELSDETRAVRYASLELAAAADPNHAEVVAVAGALPRVICLAHAGKLGPPAPYLYRADAPTSVTIGIMPPTASTDFLRSWLATDLLAWEAKWLDGLSDPNFQYDQSKFREFMETVTAPKKWTTNVPASENYHPAMQAFGIEIAVNDLGAPSFCVIPWSPTVWDSHMRTLSVNGSATGIRIEVDATLTAPVIPPVPSTTDPIRLPPGCFARIRFYALVKEKFFSGNGSDGRFEPTLSDQVPRRFAGWRAFGPLERWIEALPRWDGTKYAELGYVRFDVQAPDARSATDLRLVCTPAATAIADWIRALQINRYAWHWSSLPVSFPSWSDGDAFARWLPAFAGIESNRQQSRIDLATHFEGAGPDWKFGETAGGIFVVDGHRLRSGERPSEYAAYTVRPIVRFAKWLNPDVGKAGGPLQLARAVFAAGNAVSGVGNFGVGNRLPTPSYRYRIPLTATFAHTATSTDSPFKLERTDNGSLLVFDEAIRRTDAFAGVGGLGDTFEVDLVQTRRVHFLGQWREFAEIGPNPIFHKSPSADNKLTAKDFGQPALHVSEPYGLTYDLGRNPKVAQTAVLVRPMVGDGASSPPLDMLGQWMLAKVRVRRMILPETQLNAPLTKPPLRPVVTPHIAEPASYVLPWRAQGLEMVPYDFAVDFVGSATAPVVVIAAVGNDGTLLGRYTIELPDGLPTSGKVRLLVSFHKGRWDPTKPTSPPAPKELTGQPYWAPQVYAQVRRGDDALGWETKRKSMCYGKEAWLLRGGSLILSIGSVAPSAVYAVQLSDYTDARWLLFMGRIPGTGRQRPDEYVLTPVPYADSAHTGAMRVKLRVARGVFGTLEPPPVKPADWTESPVEFFVLLVSSSPASVITGEERISADVGVLGFVPVRAEGGTVEFVPLDDVEVKAEQLAGASAVLCSFQRITATSRAERAVSITSLKQLISAIFPDDGSGGPSAQDVESLVRPTGNHWGPMKIGPSS
jgi:hypothetical protein